MHVFFTCAQEALTDLLGFKDDPEEVLSRVKISVQEGRTCQQVCTCLKSPDSLEASSWICLVLAYSSIPICIAFSD